MEISGSGMVHPNVLKLRARPDGILCFAFARPDRLAMLKYGLPDLRDFRCRRPLAGALRSIRLIFRICGRASAGRELI
ncbi:MAG: hypothetical protein R3C60_07505 [Parvularculaceae bacterium]